VSELTLSGTANIRVNTTGVAVNETIANGTNVVFAINDATPVVTGTNLTLAIQGEGGFTASLTGNFSVQKRGAEGAMELRVGAEAVTAFVGAIDEVGDKSGIELTNGKLALLVLEKADGNLQRCV